MCAMALGPALGSRFFMFALSLPLFLSFFVKAQDTEKSTTFQRIQLNSTNKLLTKQFNWQKTKNKKKPVSTFANDHLVLYLFIPIDVWVSHSVMCADRFVSLSPSNSGIVFHYYVCILCEAKLIGLT